MKSFSLFFLLIVINIFNIYSNNIDVYREVSSKIKNESQYLTSGRKLYVVGNQNGEFPEVVSWHEKGEMGGVWALPIKLLDGFDLLIKNNHDYVPIRMNQFETFAYKNRMIANMSDYDLDIVSEQFIPLDETSLIVDYNIYNNSDRVKKIDLALSFNIDLRGGFFSNRAGFVNANDTVWYDKDSRRFYAKDLINPWYVGLTSSLDIKKYSITSRIDSKGEKYNNILCFYTIEIPAKSSSALSFYIGGSNKEKKYVDKSLNNIIEKKEDFIVEKKEHFEQIANVSRIKIPNTKIQNVYQWTRFNSDWLFIDVPKTGKGYMAGIPHYPWYFSCDFTYALQGLLATGQYENVKNHLRLLRDQSLKSNKNGRVVHSVTPDEAICNEGNTQETAHFIMGVWNTYLWTGDYKFLKEFYPYIKKNISWLLDDMDKDNNLFPYGYGIMEVSGLNAELIDVAVYTHKAIECYAEMSKIFGDLNSYNKYKLLSYKSLENINNLFWDDKLGLYCDFYGTASEAVQAAEGSLRQYSAKGNNAGLYEAKSNKGQTEYYSNLLKYFKTLDPKEEHGWLVNKNWVINTPMEAGIAPREKAIRALENMSSSDFMGQWGPYLSAVNKNHSMTISTGVQAVAECRYGRVDNGMRFVEQIANTFSKNMPGSITEMMPDYGCFSQLWTVYSLAVPIIQYVYGIFPDAPNETVKLSPQLPDSWNNISIEDQKIGDNSFDWEIRRNSKCTTYQLTWNKKKWNSILKIEYSPNMIYKLNGKKVTPKVVDNNVEFNINGNFIIEVVEKYL